MARSNRRGRKSFLSNPLILVLVFLMLAVAAASQLGLLDTLFAGNSAPPATNPAPAPRPVKPPEAGGSQAGSSATPSATVPSAPQSQPKAVADSGTPAAPAPAASTKKPTYKVPEFAFEVGRANPFMPLAGAKSGPAAAPIQRPPSGAPPQPGKPAAPKAAAAPKDPTQLWRFLGANSHGSVRFAIIETPTTSYIVKEGDRIEGIWLVTEVSGERVVLKSADRTLTLVLGGESK